MIHCPTDQVPRPAFLVTEIHDAMIKVHGIERFNFHQPGVDAKTGKDRRHLDLTSKGLIPESCATVDEFLAKEWLVPIAFMGAGDGHPLIRQDPYFCATPMYAQVKPKQLCELFQKLAPARRNLCAMVLDKRPVHIYFDLEADFPDEESPFYFLRDEDPVKVVDAFKSVFSRCFEKDFNRKPDLKGFHAEFYQKTTKLSFHMHITTERFATVYAHNNWVKDSFLPFVRRLFYEHDEAAKMLCAIDTSPNRKSDVRCMIDIGVYNRNRVFRLWGNRKPGKEAFQWLSMDSSPQPADAELLFRGLPNVSISATTDLDWDATPVGAKGRSLSSGVKSTATNTDGSDEIVTVTSHESLAWMLTVTIPWFEEKKIAQPRAERLGFYQSNGSPYVLYAKVHF